MDKDKFIEIVRMMREAQREYFKSRDNRMLIRAKTLEGACDKMLQEYDEWLKRHPVQRSLFDYQ